MVFAVRGATLVAENSEHAVRTATIELVERLVEKNRIKIGRMVSIVFSITPDVTAFNPATALRTRPRYNDVPLFCTAEPEISGAAKRVIRVLITYKKFLGLRKLSPVYINGAERLRPDIRSG
jgi:chorismate mutase